MLTNIRTIVEHFERSETTPINEGKSKVIYPTSDESLYLVRFKPHARSITAKREENIPQTEYWRILATVEMMSRLSSDDIPTNLKYSQVIKKKDDYFLVVGKIKPIPLEWIVRYEAQGSLVREYPDRVKEGDDLPCQFQKVSYKIDTKRSVEDQGLDDPTIPDSYITGFGILTPEELVSAHKLQYNIGERVKQYLLAVGIKLQDMKFEFGFDEQRNIVLIDEISQDCIRAVDSGTRKKLTKDIFRARESHGQVVSGYEEFARRLNPQIEKLIEIV